MTSPDRRSQEQQSFFILSKQYLLYQKSFFFTENLRKRNALQKTRNVFYVILVIATCFWGSALFVSAYTTYLSTKISLLLYFLLGLTLLLFFYSYYLFKNSEIIKFINCSNFIKDINSYVQKNLNKVDQEEFLYYIYKRKNFYLNSKRELFLTVFALLIVVLVVLYLLLAVSLFFPPKSSENNIVNVLAGLAAVATLEPVIEDRILKPLLVKPHERAINDIHDDYSCLIKNYYQK